MNQGRTLFAQVTELLPRRVFEDAVARYRGNHRVHSLSCMDQLLCMIFAQLTGRTSLRETVTCLASLGSRRYHMGFRSLIARSTLAEANERRDFRIFESTAMAMIASVRVELPRDPQLMHLDGDAFAIDSTTIDLCLNLFPWATFRRRKAGIKAHTMLDLNTEVPAFLHVSQAKRHDIVVLDLITPQAGAYYVMDKGYVDFVRLYRLHTAGAFFVTRAKANMDFGVRKCLESDPAAGVRADRLIRLRGVKSRDHYPDTLRLIRYEDPQTCKRLMFLTNNQTQAATTVAMLYRKRWRIELFFKWVKQHLHIKAFFGTSPNAVKIQMWIAVITYLLVVRLKHRLSLPQEVNEFLQILSLAILEKTPIIELFCSESNGIGGGDTHKQRLLFDL